MKNKFIITIKEHDQPDAKIQKHNCIKSVFEREESLHGPSKLKELKETLLSRKKYIMSKTPNHLISTRLNSIK